MPARWPDGTQLVNTKHQGVHGVLVVTFRCLEGKTWCIVQNGHILSIAEERVWEVQHGTMRKQIFGGRLTSDNMYEIEPRTRE